MDSTGRRRLHFPLPFLAPTNPQRALVVVSQARLQPCAEKQRGKALEQADGRGGGVGYGLDLEELEEFQLPMSHRPTENLDTEGLEQASVHTQITASNVGFKLL
ncbi:hypothetical protein ACP70R_004093 [Stipagrostis hirtigluma subsp. patula]